MPDEASLVSFAASSRQQQQQQMSLWMIRPHLFGFFSFLNRVRASSLWTTMIVEI